MPVCSVETEEKEMALTFETAWGEERTGDILDLLKKERCPGDILCHGELDAESPGTDRADEG